MQCSDPEFSNQGKDLHNRVEPYEVGPRILHFPAKGFGISSPANMLQVNSGRSFAAFHLVGASTAHLIFNLSHIGLGGVEVSRVGLNLGGF